MWHDSAPSEHDTRWRLAICAHDWVYFRQVILIRPTGVPRLNYPESCRKRGALFFRGCMHMRVRRIGVLIDGGFFLGRLARTTPLLHDAQAGRRQRARSLQARITQPDVAPSLACLWLDHVYRLFYYDARQP